jgi:hypothetical protein
LTTIGLVAGTLPVVLGSGASYTVKINDVRGSGDLRVDLIDNDSIVGAGLALGGTGAANGSFQGQTYTILQAPPSVMSINRATPQAEVNNPTSVHFIVTFSEAVTGVDPSDFRIVGTATTTLLQVTPKNASVYTVTVSGIGGNGTLGLNLVDDGSIRDMGDNRLAALNTRVGFEAEVTYVAGARPNSMAVMDLNRDGALDLAVANSESASIGVFLGYGDGAFQEQQTYASGEAPNSVSAGDVNGDGVLDLVAANRTSNTMSVLLGNGDGTFQTQQTFATSVDPFAATLADMNGDGKADVAISNRGSATVSVLLGNGNGTFQVQQTFATGDMPSALTARDVNADGKPDLAVAYPSGASVSVLLGNGNGSFKHRGTSKPI